MKTTITITVQQKILPTITITLIMAMTKHYYDNTYDNNNIDDDNQKE